MIRYRQILPPPHLAPYIRFYWEMEAPATTGERYFRAFADGHPGIVINNGSLYRMRSGSGWQDMAAYSMYGQAHHYLDFCCVANIATCGVYFLPHALPVFFQRPAGCFSFSNIPLEEALPRHEMESLMAATDKITWFNSYFTRQLQRSIPEDRLILDCLQQVQSGKIDRVQQLYNGYGISERQLLRRFNDTIGISPKVFIRINRFQKSLGTLRQSENRFLTGIAHQHNYTDQSHFIRDFKKFAGCCPSDYVQQQETIENFVLVP